MGHGAEWWRHGRSLDGETILCLFNLGHAAGRFRFDRPLDTMIALGGADGGGDDLPVLSALVGRV